MRGQHEKRRQAPEDDKKLAGEATPMSAAKQQDDDGDADKDQRDISGTAHDDQIGIVLVRACEGKSGRGQPEQDEADATDELHGN
jgi:hypothetical protein